MEQIGVAGGASALIPQTDRRGEVVLVNTPGAGSEPAPIVERTAAAIAAVDAPLGIFVDEYR